MHGPCLNYVVVMIFVCRVQRYERIAVFVIVKLFVEHGRLTRMPDSQSKEPGIETPLIPFRSLGIFVLSVTPQFTQLYI